MNATTENMQMAMEAINNWLYFGWNYAYGRHEFEDEDGNVQEGTLPDFIAGVKWTAPMIHILRHWWRAEHAGRDGHMAAFYGALDVANRRTLLEYVLSNYNSGMRI